jgi:predicted secreted protein
MTPGKRTIISAAFCALALSIAQTGGGSCAPAEAEKPAPPAVEEAPQWHEPRLLRLAEILGALTYLQDLCKDRDAAGAGQIAGQAAGKAAGQITGQVWRAQMNALLEAEGTTPARKERLAGSYNRGFRGYEISYRRCTPNAQAIIARFLDESGKIAHEIAQHDGPS